MFNLHMFHTSDTSPDEIRQKTAAARLLTGHIDPFHRSLSRRQQVAGTAPEILQGAHGGESPGALTVAS